MAVRVVMFIYSEVVIGGCHFRRQPCFMKAIRTALSISLSALVATGTSAPARSEAASAEAGASRPPPVRVAALRDGSRDFDFEFGTWKAHIARRLRPLTGSTDWVEFDGVSTVRKVWDGKANLGELSVKGPAGEIEGLSLRLYDPASREWKISWVNSRDGALTPPMVGGFDGRGRGEFYSEDTLGGRQIFARFIFSGTKGRTFRIEQAFSGDAGRTWEVNWIADFTR